MDRLPFYAIFEKPVPLDLLRLQRVIDTPSTSSSARFTEVLVCSLWRVIDRTALPQRRKVFSIFGAQLMLLGPIFIRNYSASGCIPSYRTLLSKL